LANKDNGTIEQFEINVPPYCKLQFEDRSVVVFVDGRNTENHNVGVKVRTFDGSPITNGKVTLTLKRTEDEVTING
jgi:hypothetical protein